MAPDDPPPWLESGFLGWRAEDDAWWRRHRARELQTLAPTVAGVSPDTRAPRLAPVVWPVNEAARLAGRPWFDFASAEWVGAPAGSSGGAAPDGCVDPDCTGCYRCTDEWAAVEVEPPPGVHGWRPPPGLRRALRLPPGAWRVVHLGTSSAVPTRNRNVSSTAFLAAPRAHPPPPPPPAVPLPPDVVVTASPSPEPWLALVDAGEGTAARVMGARWGAPHSLRWLRAIYITHVHGDHLYGLPSLLMTVGLVTSARRRAALRSKAAAAAAGTWDAAAEPIDGTDDDPVIRIYGPYGVRSFVRASLNTTALVGVRFAVSELVPREGDFAHLGRAWRPNTVGLFDDESDGGGESGEEGRGDWAVGGSGPPPPHPEEEYVPDIEADADGLWRVGGWGGGRGGGGAPETPSGGGSGIDAPSSPPLPPIIPDGRTLRKVVLLGDTADSSAIAAAAEDADLLVHEATFASALADKAAIAAHSTAAMAGAFARAVGARRLHLTHFSSRYEVWTREGTNGKEEGAWDDSLGTACVLEEAAVGSVPPSAGVGASVPPTVVEEEEEDDDDDLVNGDDDADALGGYISSTMVIDEEDGEEEEEAAALASRASGDAHHPSTSATATTTTAVTGRSGGGGRRRRRSDDLCNPSGLVDEAVAAYGGGGRVVAAKDYMEVDLLPAPGGWGRGRYGDDDPATAAAM
ncbi:hypothetical protein MMPV_002886 [Pyropia vietnamensis]